MAKILLNVELNSKVAQSGVDQLKKSIDLIANSLNNIQPNKDLTAQLNALAKAFNALAREAAQVDKTEKERAALEAKLAKLEAETATAEAKRAKATSDVAKAAANAATAAEKEREATAKADTAEQKLALQTAKTAAAIEKLSQTEEEAAEVTNTLGEKFESFIQRLSGTALHSALNSMRRGIKDALDDVGETLVKTENAVIELNRVLDDDDQQSPQAISNRLYDLAYQYGSTFENASTIAINFARAGRSWTESLQATEAALLAMNVAELDATQASDGLLSIIAQFNMEASDLVDVVDKLNKTADKNPVSTQKLLQAIQRAGSAANNANVSFDQTLGLITAISEATNRSGQNIGTAINSLIQYSTKNIDTFRTLSKESDEIVDKFRVGLASIVDVWNQVSIDIKNDKEARDNIISALGTDGLEELTSSLHDELGDLVSEMNGVYDVANTYRKNYFIALLDNMDRYMTVQEQLTDYQGYSQEENAKYLETYTAKVNQLNSAWQKLANDEQGILAFKKALVEMGIDIVTLIDNAGGLVTFVSEISGIVISLVLFVEAKKISTWFVNLGSQLGVMVTSVKNLAAGTWGAVTAAEGLQAAFGWISIAIAAVSLLVGYFKSLSAQEENARQQAISLAGAHKQNAIDLQTLYDKYLALNPESEEYREIEDKIVNILGEKAKLLPEVSKGTDDYRKAVENLTDAQLAQYKLEQLQAKQEAGKELLGDAKGLASGAKYDFYRAASSHGGLYDGSTVKNTVQSIISYYDWVEEKRLELAQQYEDLLAQGKTAAAEQTRILWQEYGKQIDAVRNKVEAYKTTVADADEVLNVINESFSETGLRIYTIEKNAEEAGEAAEEASSRYDKAAMSAEEFAESISSDVSAYKAEADAIETVRAAQQEFNETGQISLETAQKLASLGENWVSVLFDENGALDVNTTAVWERIAAQRLMLEEQGYSIDSAEKETEVVSALTDTLKDYNAQIDEAQSALSTLDAIQKEYEETGALSIDTFQKLLSLGGEYLNLLIDENGQLSLNTDAVETLKQKKLDLIEQLIRENTAQYALSLIQEKAAEKEQEVGTQAANAALKIGEFVAQLYNLKGQSSDAVIYLDALHQSLAQIGGDLGISLSDADLADIGSKTQNYYAGLKSMLGYVDTSSGWTSSSSSSSSSKSTKDEYLETLKSAVSLRESELTLMEHQGASQDEQIAKMRQIQSAIHDQAEYLRSIGASQEEINKLSSDWWKWEEKINKFAEDNAKAAEKAAEEQKKAAEEAKKAAEEAQKAETARLKQVLSDDKARLTLMEKQGKSVSERVEKMKEIQAHLHDEAEWLRQIGAEQAEIDALSAEWWDWQEKILKLYQETLDAQKQIELDAIQKTIDGILKEVDLEEEALAIEEKRLAVDEQRLKLEEAIRDAKIDYVQSVLSDYLTALSDAETLEEKQRAVAEAREKLVQAEREAQAKSIIDAFKAEKDLKSDVLSLDEKRLAVEQARQALTDAENNRTTRVYNEASGQWEYQANAKDVQSAKDSLKSAVDALNAYVEEAAWNEVAEAVENGSVSEEEVLEILSKWAKESYGNDSPEFVSKIQTAFKKAMGTATSPDSVSGQISAVDSAVKSLNEYLKQEAVKELKSYIAAGNTDAAGMRSILDKWLSMGEGSELYSWRDGLLSTVTSAIQSGYYDDSKVQSQVKAVESAVQSLHDYLRNRFIREIEDIVRNGTADQITAAIDKWSKEFDLSDTDRNWAERLYEAKSQYDTTEQFWNNVSTGNLSDDDKRAIVQRMKANSEEWWTADEARKKELADLNYVLGTSMGWRRKDDGAWYDEYDRRLYDKGGVLRGRGGIKGTDRPEIVLDPELTSQILKPGSDAQFRAFADALHLMFERGGRRADDKPVIRNPAVTDSHNTSYTVNGIPIGESMAERYTIAELFRTMPLVGAN